MKCSGGEETHNAHMALNGECPFCDAEDRSKWLTIEVQIKKSTKNPGFYEARYKSPKARHSGPLAVAKTRETLAKVARDAGMTVVQKWS